MTVFTDVKARVSLQDVVNYLRLGNPIHRKGNELRWACPACKSDDTRTLCVTLPDTGFGCWVGASGPKPKHSGDLIALVAHVRGITQTAAAKELQEHFLGSSTEPVQKMAQAKGRSEPPKGELRPLEILGISEELADRLHIVVEEGRVLFEQRDDRGIKCGTLALATRDDLPLVEWTEEDAPKIDGLKDLWRVVKGGA